MSGYTLPKLQFSGAQHVRIHTAQITVLWSTACQDTHCPNYSSLEHSMSGYTLPKLQFSGAQCVRIHSPNYSSLEHSISGYTLPKLQFSGAQCVRIHCPNYSSLEHWTVSSTVMYNLFLFKSEGPLNTPNPCSVLHTEKIGMLPSQAECRVWKSSMDRWEWHLLYSIKNRSWWYFKAFL